MSTINEKIMKIRLKKHLSQESFAEILRLKRNSISLIENGKRNPSERTISDICNAFLVDKEWLLNGEGDEPVFIEPEEDIELEELLTDLIASDDEKANAIKDIVRTYVKLDSSSRKVLDDMMHSLLKNQKGDDTIP